MLEWIRGLQITFCFSNFVVGSSEVWSGRCSSGGTSRFACSRRSRARFVRARRLSASFASFLCCRWDLTKSHIFFFSSLLCCRSAFNSACFRACDRSMSRVASNTSSVIAVPLHSVSMISSLMKDLGGMFCFALRCLRFIVFEEGRSGRVDTMGKLASLSSVKAKLDDAE